MTHAPGAAHGPVRPMRRPWPLAVLGAAALVLTSCGGESLPVSRSADGPVAYVGSDSDSVVAVQLLRDGPTLTGTVQAVQQNVRSDGAPVTVRNAQLTGTVQGQDISLDVGVGTFLGISDPRTWTGKLAGDQLELDVASQQGGFTHLQLRRSSLKTYNDAVTALTTKVTNDRETAAAEATERATESRRRDTLAAARAKLHSAIAAVDAGARDTNPAAGTLGAPVASMRGALRRQEQLAAKAKATHGCDQDDVQSEESAARSDVDWAKGDLDAAQADLAYAISTLQDALQSLDQAVRQVHAVDDGLDQGAAAAQASGARAILKAKTAAEVAAAASDAITATATRTDEMTQELDSPC